MSGFIYDCPVHGRPTYIATDCPDDIAGAVLCCESTRLVTVADETEATNVINELTNDRAPHDHANPRVLTLGCEACVMRVKRDQLAAADVEVSS